VFDFIREHNLFSAVQDQVLLLVDFDQQTTESASSILEKGGLHANTSLAINGADLKIPATDKHGKGIALLVDHTYSIPVSLKEQYDWYCA
jgi:hypothetical protein